MLVCGIDVIPIVIRIFLFIGGINATFAAGEIRMVQHFDKLKDDWWKEEVIYQIYPKSFKDSNNDGIGDIRGIIQKIDYLKNLGITMIWISPFYKSPMADNGYDISDYHDVNPDFGSMNDIEELIEVSKKNGIKIMVDLVVNHTSDEHKWFKEALSDPKSKYRDFYIIKPSKNGLPPNNWRSIFGGSAWKKIDGEDNYYLHVFHEKQPDLNWENPELRTEIYDMVNWWLSKGVAGFRIDAITFIKKDLDFSSISVDGADGLGSIKHKARNRPGIEKFLTELKENTFNKHKCVTVGEAPGVSKEEYNKFIGEHGYFNMIFDFHAADIDVESGSEWFRRSNWDVNDLKKSLFSTQLAFQNSGWGTTFIENHDQPRAISKYILDEDYQNSIGAKALANMYFFLRGTPFIYQGQEIGMTNFERNNINEFDDISSIDNYNRAILEGYTQECSLKFINKRSRDNSRTPIPWGKGKNGDFNIGCKPWLDFSHSNFNTNISSQLDDDESVLNFYKKMIYLRSKKYTETLIHGEIITIDSPDNIIAYSRVSNKEKIHSITNLSNETQSVNLPYGEIILNNYNEINEYMLPYQTLLIRSETNERL